jgi:hypothetical protein
MIPIYPLYPSEIRVGAWFKELLGRRGQESVKVGDYFVKVRGCHLTLHDLLHIEVSYLERIQIGKNQVSGIHGINLPIFHDFPIQQEYDGNLDEARVALHEFLNLTSIFSILKAIGWMIWLMSKGTNPLAVLFRHVRVMKSHKYFMTLVENCTLCNKINFSLLRD